MGKGGTLNLLEPLRKVNGCQPAAIIEGTKANGAHRIRDGNGSQSRGSPLPEAFATDAHRALSDVDFAIVGDRPVVFIGNLSDIYQSVGLVVEPWGIIKGQTPNLGDTFGKRNGRQVGTAMESALVNLGDALRDDNAVQATAVTETPSADDRELLGNIERSQVAAALKSIFADGCHRIGNDNGG